MNEAGGGLIQVIVLAPFPAEAVPVADRALDGEVAHPRLPVDRRAKPDRVDERIGRVLCGADGIDERVDRRVIIGGKADVHRALAEHETVGRGHKGRHAVEQDGAPLQVGVVVGGGVVAVFVKLEPVFELEQLPAGVVWEPLANHVPVGLLGVFENEIAGALEGAAALVAVDEEVNVAAVIVDEVQPVEDSVDRLFRHGA